jgi:hypothetical protein
MTESAKLTRCIKSFLSREKSAKVRPWLAWDGLCRFLYEPSPVMFPNQKNFFRIIEPQSYKNHLKGTVIHLVIKQPGSNIPCNIVSSKVGNFVLCKAGHSIFLLLCSKVPSFLLKAGSLQLVIFQTYWPFHLLSTILGIVCAGNLSAP